MVNENGQEEKGKRTEDDKKRGEKGDIERDKRRRRNMENRKEGGGTKFRKCVCFKDVKKQNFGPINQSCLKVYLTHPEGE